jgi:predicted metal-dependent phosphotriesterase family hydrolase
MCNREFPGGAGCGSGPRPRGKTALDGPVPVAAALRSAPTISVQRRIAWGSACRLWVRSCARVGEKIPGFSSKPEQAIVAAAMRFILPLMFRFNPSSTRWLVLCGLVQYCPLVRKMVDFDPESQDKVVLTHEQAGGLSMIMSVTGPIEVPPAGTFLPHEHVMSIFGRERTDRAVYDEARLLSATIAYLQFLKSAGCACLSDCTTAGIGRRVDLLSQISRESGIVILTNTGYYGAAGGRYLPDDIGRLSAAEISDRWMKEWEEGIDRSAIRPGFIKTGIDKAPLSPIDRVLMTAAARTHRKSGLLIQTHTGDNPLAVPEILSILETESVHPGAWVWVHAHLVTDPTHLLRAARAGCWISLDGLHPERDEAVIARLRVMKTEGLLDHVLLSHDGNAFTADGSRRPFDHLLAGFRLAAFEAGFTESEFIMLTEINPARAFEIKPRLIA